MKYQQLKKQLIKQSIMAGVLFVGLLVITGGLYWISSSYEEHNTTLKNEATTISSQATKLQEQYNKIQKDMPIYQEAVAKSKAGKLSIGHRVVEDELNQLNDIFYLNNVHITMGGVNEVKTADFKRSNGTIVSSEVTVNFQAIDDEFVYSMLDQMQKDLPGSVRITQMNLKREGDIASALQSITQRGTASLVTGGIKFTWFGLVPTELKPSDAKGAQQH